MPIFTVRFSTTLDVAVDVAADDEDRATELAWELAEEYVQTISGDARGVRATAALDGVGAYEVAEATPSPPGEQPGQQRPMPLHECEPECFYGDQYAVTAPRQETVWCPCGCGSNHPATPQCHGDCTVDCGACKGRGRPEEYRRHMRETAATGLIPPAESQELAQRLLDALESDVVRLGERIATTPEVRDDREPKTCPRCGQVCVYDGWDHVHPSGIGIGSCTAPVHDPGLDHLLEEVMAEVLRQDTAEEVSWRPFGQSGRVSCVRAAAREIRAVRDYDQVTGGSELFRETTELKPERRCPHCMDPDRVTTPGEQPTDPGQQVPICAAEREDNSGWWTCTMLPGHEGWHHAYDEEGGTLCASWSAEPTTPVHDPGAGHEGWHRDGDCNWGTADREVEARCSKDHCDRLCDQALSDRDRYHEVADQLASLLAPPEVLGDHSSMNDPWQNAMDHAEGQAGRGACKGRGRPEEVRDDREPKTCPRCGHSLQSHVNPGGCCIGTCPCLYARTPVHDPGLDHLLEEVAAKVLRQDDKPYIGGTREQLITLAARCIRSVLVVEPGAGGDQ